MDLNKTGLLYAGIDNNKQVVSVYFGEEKKIRKELPEGHDIVLVTEENTPINQYYYYNGNKFVKELNNVI